MLQSWFAFYVEGNAILNVSAQVLSSSPHSGRKWSGRLNWRLTRQAAIPQPREPASFLMQRIRV
jgi:hypothetical protein